MTGTSFDAAVGAVLGVRVGAVTGTSVDAAVGVVLGIVVGALAGASVGAVFRARRVAVVGALVGALTGTSLVAGTSLGAGVAGLIVAFPLGAHPRGCAVAAEVSHHSTTKRICVHSTTSLK